MVKRTDSRRLSRRLSVFVQSICLDPNNIRGRKFQAAGGSHPAVAEVEAEEPPLGEVDLPWVEGGARRGQRDS